MADWAIRARSLGKAYRLYDRPLDRLRELLSPTRARYHRESWALKEVDLEIEKGTVTGIIGVNGAGKSTFLKLVAGKLAATTGTIEARGRVSAILELGTGFQAHLSGRQNALVNALFLGQRPWEAETKLDQILDFSGLGQYADQPLSTYSSGMQARLAFSVLTTIDPEVLVLDEALATGDVGFAERCKAFLRGLCRSGCTTVVASHDYAFISEACDRVIWIDAGRVRADGPPRRVVQSYLEELGAHVDLSPRPRHVLVKIEAEDPSLGHPFCFHAFEWLGPAGEVLGEAHVGDDRIFLECVSAAAHLGLSAGSARAGWGPSQDLRGNECGLNRACRPDLGPGGAAFFALAVPPVPSPLPTKLRVAMFQADEPTAAIISVFANGRFHELGRLRDASPPWHRPELDVTGLLAEEGKGAPGFDAARVVERSQKGAVR
jgi:ABC-type polysaccharide/polyol phosphate transport system ATPase subunit